MIKVLVTYKGGDGLNNLIGRDGYEVKIYPKPSPDEFLELIRDFDCLLIRSEVQVNERIINNAKSLKLIGRAGTGVDNIDLEAATKKGILVVNVPGGNTISAAEHTFALLLSLVRNIPQARNSLISGRWERERFVGRELFGKVLGLIGLGRIGREVSRRAFSFGMRVIACDPYVSEEYARKIGVELKSLDDLLTESDFISLHVPLTDSTKYLINKETIKKMKDGVRIINTSRGGVINELDLYDSLKSGKVSGAALDVFENEPLKDSKLFELENVVLTPHLGASTEEAQTRISSELSQMVINFFERGIVTNAINMPSVDLESYEKMSPYLELVEKMGRFQSKFLEGGIREIDIEYRGEIVDVNIAILSTSFLRGLLNEILNLDVNFVNAPHIAKERGIKVRESKIRESEDYTTLISTKVKTTAGSVTMDGTVFSKQHPRIVNISGLSVDIIPKGYFLVMKNIDKPGVIGRIGTLLGRNKINIASMQVGRKRVGADALTIFNVDSIVEQEIVEKISQDKDILMVKFVKL